MVYNSEVIVGLVFIIVLLLLLVAGLSSELRKQKQNAKRIHDRLSETLDKSQKAVERVYTK
jgi:ABC-type Fe3+-citrate transport system substrate-binding protein